MGFKCPVCIKDFGLNKDEWEDHIKTEHRGISLDILRVIKKIAEPDNNALHLTPSRPRQRRKPSGRK